MTSSAVPRRPDGRVTSQAELQMLRLGGGQVLLRGQALRAVWHLAEAGVEPVHGPAGKSVSPELRWLLDQLAAEASHASSDPMKAQRVSSAQAAEILGCSERYARRIAASLDGRREGARWTFDRLTVENYRLEKGSR